MIYRLDVTLLDVAPLVQRKIEVSSSTTLAGLHIVLQAAMGWQNYHLCEFEREGKRWGEPDSDSDDELIAADSAVLGDVLRKVDELVYYTYDFGDGWEHEIALDEILPDNGTPVAPRVLSGARSCPPEDSGGPFGYQNLLKALANPKHPEHRELKAWAGKKFDPERFSVKEANMRLARYPFMR